MYKIDEAKEFLKMLGMPKAQQADICCYVLLAMAGIKRDTAWSDARNEWIRIHDIIQFANTYYGSTYAENSRNISIGGFCSDSFCIRLLISSVLE